MGVSVYEQQESKENVFAAFHCPEIKAINVTSIPQQAHIHTYDTYTHTHDLVSSYCVQVNENIQST